MSLRGAFGRFVRLVMAAAKCAAAPARACALMALRLVIHGLVDPRSSSAVGTCYCVRIRTPARAQLQCYMSSAYM